MSLHISFAHVQRGVLAILVCTLWGCTNHGTPSASANSISPASIAVGPAPQSYADVVDRVAPAVVTIRSARRIHAARQFPFLDDPFFRELFGGSNRREHQESPPLVEHALGSGVIVSPDGYIVTNHHVVDGADEISVELNGRRTFQAKLIGSDPPSDVAILKISARGLTVVPSGDSNVVRVGDVCLALGNPLGLGETVTAGIISAKGRSTGLSDGSFEDFLQTDASINQGNSGGALVNTAGELIGINSQIISPTGGNIGIGFAIPSNMTRNVMDQLTHGGHVHRGMLGVGIQAVTSRLAGALNLKSEGGVLVNSVQPGGPAEKAGIHAGDVIVKFNGTPVNDPNDLRNRIAATPPGTNVTLTIVRDGHEQQVSAHLSGLPEIKESAGDVPQKQGSGAPEQLGLSVEPLTPDVAAQLGLRRGTQGLRVIEVDPAGAAAEAGIEPMDVIVEVNHTPVRSAAEVKAAIRLSGSRPVLLLVNRNGQNLFLTVAPTANGGEK